MPKSYENRGAKRWLTGDENVYDSELLYATRGEKRGILELISIRPKKNRTTNDNSLRISSASIVRGTHCQGRRPCRHPSSSSSLDCRLPTSSSCCISRRNRRQSHAQRLLYSYVSSYTGWYFPGDGEHVLITEFRGMTYFVLCVLQPLDLVSSPHWPYLHLIPPCLYSMTV